MKQKGDFITVEGRTFELDECIGGGGEGSVFSVVGRKDILVKLINTAKKTEQEISIIKKRIDKLIEIRKASRERAQKTDLVPLNSFMTIPQFSLENDVGYVMKKIDNSEPLMNFLIIPKDPVEQEEWQRKYDLNRKYKVIAYLFERLEKIHIEGLVFSDLSPNNILVKKTLDNSITFIDTDNLRTRDNPFTNVLGTPGFIAPEIFKTEQPNLHITEDECKKLNSIHMITEASDIYSAAVIAFELLTLNHPYKGIKAVGPNTTPEDELAAERGEFDYILKPGTDNYCEGNVFIEKFKNVTTPEIRDLFARTFIDGKNSPLRRPTAHEFRDAFQRARRLIIKCPECGEETIYSTYFDDNNKLVSDTRCLNPECEAEIKNHLMFVVTAETLNGSVEHAILENDQNGLSPNSVVLTKMLLEDMQPELIYFSDLGIPGDLTKNNRVMQIMAKEDRISIRVEQLVKDSRITVCSYSKGESGNINPAINVNCEFPYNHDYLRIANLPTKYGNKVVTIYGRFIKI